MTQAVPLTADQDEAAGYLQGQPGERLRLQEVARGTGLTNQRPFIALCALLTACFRGRPGRGTCQWDPVGAATAPGSAAGPDCAGAGTDLGVIR
jgi:hypothetical protein